MLSDWRNYETWQEAGSPEVPAEGEPDWKELSGAYEPPPMDEGIREELDAFVARRVAEGGVPTDYSRPRGQAAANMPTGLPSGYSSSRRGCWMSTRDQSTRPLLE